MSRKIVAGGLIEIGGKYLQVKCQINKKIIMLLFFCLKDVL